MFIPIKPSILIIDDDTTILRVFSRIFQKKGYCVTVAERGKDAIDKLGGASFDVALIDFCLPDMEGTQLFSVIDDASPKTLKIMLTGEAFLKNSIEGADAFFGKPINPDILLSLIESKLKDRDMET